VQAANAAEAPEALLDRPHPRPRVQAAAIAAAHRPFPADARAQWGEICSRKRWPGP